MNFDSLSCHLKLSHFVKEKLDEIFVSVDESKSFSL